MTEQATVKLDVHTATILIVEDDLTIQQLLHDVLKMHGYNVVVSGEGAAAIATLESELIDLVLLDVTLPDMDGYSVCQHIRAGISPHLPVIMLTALTQPQNAVTGLRAGADEYLTKPFFPQELLLRIEGLLRHRQEQLMLDSENGALRTMLELVHRDLDIARQQTQAEAIQRRELLHNVTTHIQSLTAIIDAEIRRLPPGGERDAVQRVRGRVRGAALVYQVSEALQGDTAIIGDIINMTASALKSIYRPWKRIVINVNGPQLELPVSLVSPLAMIVNELVTNCFKHAFPDNRFGTIDISFRQENMQFLLMIADDGVGMSSDAAHGRGCATVTQLANSIGGTAEWNALQQGTCVSLQLSLAPHMQQAETS